MIVRLTIYSDNDNKKIEVMELQNSSKSSKNGQISRNAGRVLIKNSEILTIKCLYHSPLYF